MNEYTKTFIALLRMVNKMSFWRFLLILLTLLLCIAIWQAPAIILALK
jgi:hypothetical protein